jgi:hypothetical protein
MRDAQVALTKPFLFRTLSFMKGIYAELPSALEELETRTRPRVISMGTLDNITATIAAVPGPIGKAASEKLDNVLKNKIWRPCGRL